VIRFFDYRPQLERLAAKTHEAIGRVLNSGQLILGPECLAFEEEFARHLGVRFAVSVNSGTDALVIAFKALGIKPGQEIVTVANTAVPTASAIRMVGAKPKFVDIDSKTWQMDVDKLEAELTRNTAAIVPVHLYGNMVAMGELQRIARKHGIPVIEDCAQAFGSRASAPAGTAGEIGCFSFYPTKNLGAFGDGGMCVTNDEGIAKLLRSYRMYGFEGSQPIAMRDGINSRLDEMQAACLRVKLADMDWALAERRRIAAQYKAELSHYNLNIATSGVEHSYHLFTLRVKNRAEFTARFKELGVGFGIHYPEAIHRMPAFRDFSHERLTETERVCAEIVSLPLYPGMPASDVAQVIAAVRGK
jgi:dTDP-4-amino-4,6-dideoxygalactose transaminase